MKINVHVETSKKKDNKKSIFDIFRGINLDLNLNCSKDNGLKEMVKLVDNKNKR